MNLILKLDGKHFRRSLRTLMWKKKSTLLHLDQIHKIEKYSRKKWANKIIILIVGKTRVLHTKIHFRKQKFVED